MRSLYLFLWRMPYCLYTLSCTQLEHLDERVTTISYLYKYFIMTSYTLASSLYHSYAASGVLNKFLSTVRTLDLVSDRGVSPYTIKNAGRTASLLYTTVSS